MQKTKLDKENNHCITRFCNKCNSKHVITAEDVQCVCYIDHFGVKFNFFAIHDCGNTKIFTHELSKELQEILCFKALDRLK